MHVIRRSVACVALGVSAPLALPGRARAVATTTGVELRPILLVDRLTIAPLFQRYLYRPLVAAIEKAAEWARPIQSDDVNLYPLYVFVVVLIAYLLGAL